MLSCPDFVQAAPKGRYPSKIVGAEPGFSKEKRKADGTMGGNESHIKLTAEIIDGPYKGQTAEDYIGTDGTTKYGIGGKRKLRQLGVDVSSDAEVPDSVIAQAILGMQLMIEYGNEPRQRDVGNGKYEDVVEIDSKTGATVIVNRLTIVGYVRAQAPQGVMAQPGQHVAQAPQAQFVAPQGAPPPGYPTGPFPGAPVAGAPMPMAAPPGVPGALPQAWGGAPAPGYAPNGAAPQAPALVPAPPGWGAPAAPAPR